MDQQIAICVKVEETNERSSSSGSMVQAYLPSVKIKEEFQECVNEELLQDPLKIEEPCFDVKVDPGLEWNMGPSVDGGSFHYLENPSVVLESTDSAVEDSKLNLGQEETENLIEVYKEVYSPEYDPYRIKKKESLASENDCLDECDPLSITDEEDFDHCICTVLALVRIYGHSCSDV